MKQRPLPKRSWRHTAVTVVVFLVFTALVEWCAVLTNSRLLMGVPFFAAIIYGLFVTSRRCPVCRRRLTMRRQSLDDEQDSPTCIHGRYRVVYDCKHCNTTWQSDLIGDTKYDDMT